MVILYDPNCSICRKIKTILSEIDLDHAFVFTPITDEEVFTQNPSLNYWDVRKTIHIIDDQGHIFKSEHAVIKILEKIKLLKKLGPVLTTKVGLKMTKIGYEALNQYRLRQKENCSECQL